jgi:gliding motility-associated-like protein
VKKFILVFSLLLSSFHSFAQQWLWGRRAGSTDCYAIAVDNNGNSYETGDYGDSIIFGSHKLIGGSDNPYLVKYDSNGNAIWAKTIPIGLYGTSVCTCSLNDLYVTGVARGVYATNLFLSMYDDNGNIIWAIQPVLGSSRSWGTGQSVSSDSHSNAYLIGTFNDTLTFGTHTVITNSPNGINFLVKYDANGNAIWARQALGANSNCYCKGNSVTTDNSGNIYVTGDFYGTVFFGAFSLNSVSYYRDIFLVKYDSNGNVLWAKQSKSISPFSYSSAKSVVTDSFGSSYITGYFGDTVLFGTQVLNNVPNWYPNYGQIFLAKYDASGNLLWVNDSHDNTLDWSGYSLAIDENNRIYLSGGGYYITPLNQNKIVFGKDTFALIKARDPSIVLQLDTGGNVLCGSAIRTGGDDNNGIASSKNGRFIYLSGDIWDSITFNHDLLTDNLPGGAEYFFVARWQPCGFTNTVPSVTQTEPCNSLFIPNAFSPNKDGQNDILFVRGDCIKAMQFDLFDRWGEKVFESENQSNGWDGTYKGEPMTTGTYVWYLKATLNDGSVIDKKGSVALVR